MPHPPGFKFDWDRWDGVTRIYCKGGKPASVTLSSEADDAFVADLAQVQATPGYDRTPEVRRLVNTAIGKFGSKFQAMFGNGWESHVYYVGGIQNVLKKHYEKHLPQTTPQGEAMTHLIPLDEPLIDTTWEKSGLRQHFRHPHRSELSYRVVIGGHEVPRVYSLSLAGVNPLHFAYLTVPESAFSAVLRLRSGIFAWNQEPTQSAVRAAMLTDRDALVRQAELLLGLIDPELKEHS